MLRLLDDEFLMQCVIEVGYLAANDNRDKAKLARRALIEELAKKLLPMFGKK